MHTRVESPRICLRLGFVLGDLLAVCILPLNMGVYLYVRTRVSRRVLFGDIGVFQVVGTENMVALRGCESLSQRDTFYRVVGRQQFMTRGARLAGGRGPENGASAERQRGVFCVPLQWLHCSAGSIESKGVSVPHLTHPGVARSDYNHLCDYNRIGETGGLFDLQDYLAVMPTRIARASGLAR